MVRLADSLGVLHAKRLTAGPFGRRGLQDREFYVGGGRPLIIEFKAPGEQLEPLQAHYFNRLRRLGYDVHVIDDPEEGKRILRSRVEAAKGAARGR